MTSQQKTKLARVRAACQRYIAEAEAPKPIQRTHTMACEFPEGCSCGEYERHATAMRLWGVAQERGALARATLAALDGFDLILSRHVGMNTKTEQEARDTLLSILNFFPDDV